MSDQEQRRRYKRVDFLRKVKLYLGSDLVLNGVTHDISTHGAAFFVNFKGAEAFLTDGKKDHKIPMKQIKEKLIGELLLMEIEKTEMEALDLEITRVEASWKKGFHLFVGGNFKNDNEFLTEKIKKIAPKVGSFEGKREIYESDKIEEAKKQMHKERADEYHYSYRNGYRNIKIHRDLVAQLVQQNGFQREDVYVLKLLVDELLMNAFLYGSIVKGKDRTEIDILLTHDRIMVTIRDFSGEEFDDYPYHFRKEKKHEKGGLSLLEELSDDWHVKVKKGSQTEVTFFKKVSSED